MVVVLACRQLPCLSWPPALVLLTTTGYYHICDRRNGHLGATVTQPVTESLILNWQPTVHYYQHRLDPLAELESLGLLRRFRLDDDEIGAQTDDAQLFLSPSQAQIQTRGGLLSGTGTQLLRLALRAANPSGFVGHLGYQNLRPIVGQSYDQARIVALNRLAGSLLEGLPGAFDFAFLLDGRNDNGDQWHCEFGIVSQEEILPRLRREVGQIRALGGVSGFIGDEPTDMPIAFFSDVLWHFDVPAAGAPADDVVDQMSERFQGLTDETEVLVSQLYSHLCEGSLSNIGGEAER